MADSWHLEVDGFSIEGPMRARLTRDELRRRWVEPFMVQLFRQVVGPGMTVLDIGAFLGQYTLLAARRVERTGRVYAFEPEPVNFSFLVGNIERNALSDRVVARRCAVTERSGMQTFFLDPDEGSGSSLYFRRRRKVAETIVESVALDQFFDESTVVDVIKLDVEAGELKALNGMEQTVNRGSHNLVMFVECFPRGLQSAGTTPQALVARLEGFGFRVMVIDERHKRLVPITSSSRALRLLTFRSWFDSASAIHINLLCLRSAEHPLLADHQRAI